MSEYAKKSPDHVKIDLGARYASIAIRDQLKEIQQGISALVLIPQQQYLQSFKKKTDLF